MSVVASGSAGHSTETAGVKPEEGGDDVKSSWPLRLGLPCYDFVPVVNHTVVTVFPKVKQTTSGATHFHDVTGGVYKARARINRDILIRDY